MQNMSGGKTSVLGLDSNLATLLCYVLTPCCLIGTILSLIFFFTEKNNKFVKFHALQSILIFVLNVVLSLAVGVLVMILTAARMGGLATGLSFLSWLISLVFLAILIFAGIKAYQGNMFKLPVLGDLADKWSN